MAKSKLLSRWRFQGKLLKVYAIKNGVRGKLYKYNYKDGKLNLEFIESQDCVDDSYNEKTMQHHYVEQMKYKFDMTYARFVTSDNYYCYITLYSNNNYDEWKAIQMQEGEDEEALTYERYYDDCDLNLDNERDLLYEEVDGCIVAYADLGLWDGRHKGAKVVGRLINRILSSSDDENEWFCDFYNVRGTGSHHDGTNHYLYRVAKDEETARKIVDKIAYGDMDEKGFRKATRSLRPYIQKIYGF